MVILGIFKPVCLECQALRFTSLSSFSSLSEGCLCGYVKFDSLTLRIHDLRWTCGVTFITPYIRAIVYFGGEYEHVPVSVCLCLCLSVTSRCSIEVVGRFDLVFGMEASFDLF